MKKNSFVEGTLIATAAIIFTKILGVLYVIPFYNIIGSEGSSLYSYAYNIYIIFLSISTAGIPTAISKIVSNFNSREMQEAKVRTFKIGVLIVSILSVISFVILLFFSENIARLIIGSSTGGNSIEDITLVIFVVSFAVLIIPFLSIARGYLQGHNYISPSSNSQAIEQIVRIIVIVAGSYVAIKMMHLSNSVGVAVAVSGAFVGGLAAIAYISKKILTHKKQLSLTGELKKDKITNKELVRIILRNSIPFVIINVAVNLYNVVDMTLIIRTLSKLGYVGMDAEYIAGVVATWGYKLNMIINSVATGLTISLIPSIVSAYALHKEKEVNDIFNKALQIVLFISIPAAIGLSILAVPVWGSFYSFNEFGPLVFKFTVITAIFSNVYLVSIQTAQSLNRFKIVYIGVLSGFIINAILDVPMMLLFNKWGIWPFYGATAATIIGYFFSIGSVNIYLHKVHNISYKNTFGTLFKILIAAAAMVLALELLKLAVPLTPTTRLYSILQIVLYAVIGAYIYLSITYKFGIINEMFGEKLINKVLKIMTFGLYKKGAKNVSTK